MSMEKDAALVDIARAILDQNIIDTDLGSMVTELPGGSIWWTGWKEWPDSCNMTAQIHWWPPASAPKPKTFYAVMLPGFQVHRYLGGENVRFPLVQPDMVATPMTSRGELREMFMTGLRALVETVAEENPSWLEDAIKLGDRQWDRRAE